MSGAHLGPGGRLVITSHDVARLAGVSQPTVSRALRDSAKVSAATKERVRKAAAALGYSPSAIGRALSMGRSTRVGLVVTDLVNEFYPHVLAPMHGALEERGHELVLVSESSRGPAVDQIVSAGLCGVVLATVSASSELPVRLRERGVPFVHFNRATGSVEADSVTVDPEPGIEQLVADAARSGHRRVAAVFGPRETGTGSGRERAVRRSLARHGLALAEEDVLHGPFDVATGYHGARSLLQRAEQPTLLLCSSDVVAMGALNAAVELGLAVPQQVSVVGFDDLPTSRWPLIRLSTVAYDLDAMAREAATMLVDRVEAGPAAPVRSVVFTSRYVPRATTGPPPAP